MPDPITTPLNDINQTGPTPVTPVQTTNPYFPPEETTTVPTPPVVADTPPVQEIKTENDNSTPQDSTVTDLPPVITSEPSKPKPKIKMVATILGLLLLIGGVGTGIVLVQQNQDVREKASTCQANGLRCEFEADCCSGICSPEGICTSASQKMNCGLAYNGTCVGLEYFCAREYSGSLFDDCDAGTKCGIDCSPPGASVPIPSCGQGLYCGGANGSQISGTTQCADKFGLNWCCPAGQQINTAGSSCFSPQSCKEEFLDCGSNRDCCSGLSCVNRKCQENTPPSQGGTITPTATPNTACPTIPSVDVIQGSGITIKSGFDASKCFVNKYFCQDIKTGNMSCGTSTGGELVRTNAQSASLTPYAEGCGTEQIDLFCPCFSETLKFTSLVYPKPCDDFSTTPPGPSASCSLIKTYGSDWTEILPANRSSLAADSQVYFCVTGSSSEGVFDKGRFTINGTLRAETTVKRPGSNDYCDLYTIPTGVTNFTVKGEVHHASLGWF